MNRLLPVLLVLMAVGTAMTPRLGAAHAAFIASNPAPDSILAAPPAEFVVTFSESVSRLSTVVVISPGGATVSGPSVVSGNRVSVTVQPAGGGVYRVDRQNVSLEDGHETRGSLQFTVSAPVAASAPAVRPAAPAAAPVVQPPAPVTARPVQAPMPGPGMPRTGGGLGEDTPTGPLIWLVLLTAMIGGAAGIRLRSRGGR